jgi:hypothetical protein
MTPMRTHWFVVFLLISAAVSPAAEMDYGSFVSSSLDRDPAVSKLHAGGSTEQTGDDDNNLAAKAVTVRLRADGVEAAVAFDTDLLRYVGGWTGGFLNLEKTHLTTEKGTVPPSPKGKFAFTTPLRTPGVSNSPDDGFADPRPRPFGPLPKTAGYYKGLYRHGERVLFRYAVGDTDVLDTPGLVALDDGNVGFTRTLRIAAGPRPLCMLVCSAGPGVQIVDAGGISAALRVVKKRHIVLDIPARDKPATLKVLVRAKRPAPTVSVPRSLPSLEDHDLDALTRGGPALWPTPIITDSRLAPASSKPYVVDELTLPFKNPWNAWLRATGFDFFRDGTRAAVCTWNGDVWVVSGIGSNPEKFNWRRFAAGLYEPLGLVIVDDVIYARGRDQITRLHDLNGDGEADFYENFNNDGVVSANYHGFAMDLATDADGNFYYVRCGQRMHPDLPAQGSLVRVSRDGATSTAVASGLRAANGIGIGPNGEITAGDNQGNWTPACRLNLIRPGGFYGYMPHVRAAGGPPRDDYDPPLCWLPMSLDSSSGSQAWVPPGETRWGPLAGQLLHTSYGRASLMLVMRDDGATGDIPQGGAFRFPLSFASGVMRARFNPKDGQLYLCGLKAWQTSGTQDGTFCRVRYTGKPVEMPVGFRVLPDGIELSFTCPLDPETANDPESFGVEQWNYRWTKEYGSADYSVADPEKKQRDEVTVKTATLRPDGKTVFLAIPDLKPVMQISIQYDLDTKAGDTINDTVHLTINRLPGGVK